MRSPTAGPAEQAGFPALGERAEQVDDLDSRLQGFADAQRLVDGCRLAVDVGVVKVLQRGPPSRGFAAMWPCASYTPDQPGWQG